MTIMSVSALAACRLQRQSLPDSATLEVTTHPLFIAQHDHGEVNWQGSTLDHLRY